MIAKLSETATRLKKEFKNKFGIAIAGAFAFVLALSWNDFVAIFMNSKKE